MTRFNSLLPWLIASGLFLYIIWSDGNIRQLSGFRSPPSIFSARNEDYDPAFHFLIAQSHRTDALCYQLQLFFQYGYFDPIMIAYTGVSYHTQWIETNKAKIPNTTEWLRAHTRERDIVFFLDGGDVWPQSRPDEMLATYFENNYEFHIAASKHCWPLVSEKMCEDVPKSPLNGKEMYNALAGQIAKDMPYAANGGHYIGRAGTILRAHERMMRELELPRWPDLGIDQLLLQFLYWEGLHNMTLDMDLKFFQTMDHYTDADLTIENLPGRPRPLYRNNWSNTIPHTTHFSGPKWKRKMANITATEPSNLSGWPSIPPVVHFANAPDQLFTDFCPGYPISVP